MKSMKFGESNRLSLFQNLDGIELNLIEIDLN